MVLHNDNQEGAAAFTVDPQGRIGHVHLEVADFDQAVFLSAGGYHHHLALNTWESLGGSPPPRGTTGLYHTAILYPSRAALAIALHRILVAEIPLEGATDHGVSESIYLRDPDGNGVELYRDKPKEQWPLDARGNLATHTRRLDLRELLKEAPNQFSPGPQDL